MSRTRHHRRWPWVVLVLLVAVWVALPFVIRAAIQASFRESPDYDGSIGRVWVGFKTIHVKDLHVVRRDGGLDVVTLPSTTAKLSLLSLFRGVPEFHFSFDRPKVLVREEKTGEQKDVRSFFAKLRSLPHVKMSVEASDGDVKIVTPELGRGVELRDLALLARDLENRPVPDEELPSKIAISARIGPHGHVDADLEADIMARPPRAEITLRAHGVPLRIASRELEKKEGVKIQSGTASTSLSISLADGRYSTAAKAGVQDVDLERKPGGNALDALKAHLAEGAAKLAEKAEGGKVKAGTHAGGRLKRPDAPLSEGLSEALRGTLESVSPG